MTDDMDEELQNRILGIVDVSKFQVGSASWQFNMMENILIKKKHGLEMNSMEKSFIPLQIEHLQNILAEFKELKAKHLEEGFLEP